MANVDSNTYYMKGQILFVIKKKTKTKTKHSDFTKKFTDNINMIEFLFCFCFFCFFLQNKICPFIGLVFESTLAILFNETQLDQPPYSVFHVFVSYLPLKIKIKTEVVEVDNTIPHLC